ncbi:hypothetical protein Acr_00g0092960 [Actinidia rufa]|uniref:Uncharacterized protein n=1 Tax=Actinidia rufa TaxID=165716 RepID=A0A7J0DXR0_9ERIC|nr:hypothetical protein Acr_00g0092960 [Actinidia rufa]
MTQDELDRLIESCSILSGIQIRLPEVAFYEATFLTGLCLSIYPTIKRILHFYNICHAQLVPNEWRSVLDSGWLCFKARPKKTLLGGKRYNKPPVLSKIKQDRLDGILNSLVEGDLFTIKEVLESKSFPRSFGLGPRSLASSCGDNTKDKLTGSASLVVGDEAVSRRINLNKLAQLAEGSRSGSPTERLTPVEKGASEVKKKGSMPPPKAEKKGSSAKASIKSRATSSAVANRGAVPAVAPGEGTSANPGAVLGLKASMLVNPAVEELKKTKEDRDATIERLVKKMIEMKKKEALIKMQIGRLHPDLDIQGMGIDAEMLEKEEEDEEDEEEPGKEKEEEEKEGEPDNPY